jgi:alpha-glucoside transport system substrate-binding protein
MALFTDNPNARNLLNYLASSNAQTLWVRQNGGYAFSADQAVTPAAYPADVQRKIARQFLQADGIMLCFSAEDMMQPDMSNAFEQAVLDYINNPGSLPGLLADLQATQNGAGDSPSVLAKRACAPP